jgi:hypothetical protein
MDGGCKNGAARRGAVTVMARCGRMLHLGAEGGGFVSVVRRTDFDAMPCGHCMPAYKAQFTLKVRPV